MTSACDEISQIFGCTSSPPIRLDAGAEPKIPSRATQFLNGYKRSTHAKLDAFKTRFEGLTKSVPGITRNKLDAMLSDLLDHNFEIPLKLQHCLSPICDHDTYLRAVDSYNEHLDKIGFQNVIDAYYSFIQEEDGKLLSSPHKTAVHSPPSYDNDITQAVSELDLHSPPHPTYVTSNIPVHSRSSSRPVHTVSTSLPFKGTSILPTTTPANSFEPIPHPLPSVHHRLSHTKIDIPKFSGNPLEYNRFMNSFLTHTKEHPLYTDADRFEILRDNLRGEPLNSLNHLSIANDSYQKSLDILNKRYNKPRIIMDDVINKIMALSASSTSPADMVTCIRTLCDYTVSMSPSECSKCGVERPIIESLPLRMIIKSKVPASYWHKTHMMEDYADRFLSIPELFQTLESSALSATVSQDQASSFARVGELQESSCPSAITHMYPAYSNHHPLDKPSHLSLRPKHEHPKNSSKKLTNSGRSKVPRDDSTCFFCRKAHSSANCPDFVSPSSRRCYLLSIKRPCCWICFADDHRSRSCSLPACPLCNGDHSVLLCSSVPPTPPSQTFTSINVCAHTEVDLHDRSPMEVSNRLPFARLQVHHSRPRSITALIDSGAQRSLILEAAAIHMDLKKLGRINLSFSGFRGIAPAREYNMYSLALLRQDGSILEVPCVGVTELIGSFYLPEHSPPDLLYLKTKHIDVSFLPSGEITPALILGVDAISETLGKAIVTQLSSGLHLYESELGPIICGQSRKKGETNCHINVIASPQHETDDELLHGIDSKETTDSLAWEKFHASVNKSASGRLSVSFPFVSPPSSLKSNYSVAKCRLHHLYNKHRNTTLWNDYTTIINDQLRLGILESSSSPSNVGYYIPHSAVLKPSSATTRVRIVFDASSHQSESPSLNDLLLPGPSLIPDLLNLFLVFRTSPHVAVADIEKAFHQVEVNSEHRMYTKILWLKDPSCPPHPNNIIELQHTRLPFGVTSSPFLLSASILFHLKHKTQPVARSIPSRMYVDNLLLAEDSLDRLKEGAHDSIAIFKELGMNLREFVSNDNLSLQDLDKELHCKRSVNSFLGLTWDSVSDTFTIPSPLFHITSTATSREALSVLASFFDPLGLWSPALLLLRLHMNKLWPEARQYDCTVSSEEVRQWFQHAENLKSSILSFPIPRTLTFCQSKKITVFTDASFQALGSCLYLHDGTRSFLVAAKTLLAPKATTPRLELAAFLMGMKMVLTHLSQLSSLSSTLTFYVDSHTVLYWIYGDSLPSPTYVRNRLQKAIDGLEKVKAKLRRDEGSHRSGNKYESRRNGRRKRTPKDNGRNQRNNRVRWSHQHPRIAPHSSQPSAQSYQPTVPQPIPALMEIPIYRPPIPQPIQNTYLGPLNTANPTQNAFYPMQTFNPMPTNNQTYFRFF